MSEPQRRRTDDLEQRHRRIWRGSLLASLLLHLLVAFLFWGDRTPRSPFAAAGPRAGDDRAAAAGGGMQALDLRVTPPVEEEIPRPPEPVPVPAPEVEFEPEPEPQVQPINFAEMPGAGGRDRGPEAGAGREGGAGQGDGGTEAEGRFRVAPPSPRGLILPPGDRPRRVRGREVAVWVFVTDRGRVVPDSTRVLPSTGDRKFDDLLMRQAAEWVFEPARKEGKAVAEWFRYVIGL